MGGSIRIVMLNGAFGAGKTTLAEELLARRPEWLLFDPEEVGAMLWRVWPEPRGDFQALAPWAPLVVATARALVEAYGRTLVVPMTLVDPGNLATIREGFEAIAPTHHFALIASPALLVERLRERGADAWAFDQIDRCVAALDGPGFEVRLDASRPVGESADSVLDAEGVVP